jgi:hypothetical protein
MRSLRSRRSLAPHRNGRKDARLRFGVDEGRKVDEAQGACRGIATSEALAGPIRSTTSPQTDTQLLARVDPLLSTDHARPIRSTIVAAAIGSTDGKTTASA